MNITLGSFAEPSSLECRNPEDSAYHNVMRSTARCILVPIHLALAACALSDGGIVEANKALLRSAYEAVSRRDPGPLTEALSEDVVWTIIGTTRMSGTARGKKEVAEKIFVPLRASLSDAPLRFEIDRMIGEGEWVVMLARGYATTREGKPYNNTYAIVARFENGKIVEMTDYIDTALINEVLNP